MRIQIPKNKKFLFLIEIIPNENTNINVDKDVIKEELDELLSESLLISKYNIKNIKEGEK